MQVSIHSVVDLFDRSLYVGIYDGANLVGYIYLRLDQRMSIGGIHRTLLQVDPTGCHSYAHSSNASSS